MQFMATGGMLRNGAADGWETRCTGWWFRWRLRNFTGRAWLFADWRFELPMESSMRADVTSGFPGSSAEAREARRLVCYCLWNFAFSASLRC